MTLAPLALRYRHLSPFGRLAAWLGGTLLAAGLWLACLWLAGAPADAWQRPEEYPRVQQAYLAGLYVLLVGGALGTWRLLEGAPLAALGCRLDGGAVRAACLGALGGVGMLGGLLLVGVVSGVSAWHPERLGGLTPALALEVVAMAGMFAASEEVLFRGFVLQTLRRGWSDRAAVLAAAAVFAAPHFLRGGLAPWQLVMPAVGLVLTGAFLGWLAVETGSIWPGVGLHAGWLMVFLPCDRLALAPARPGFEVLSGAGYPPAGVAMWLVVAATWGLLSAWRRRPLP